jgi:hypothetical protein
MSPVELLETSLLLGAFVLFAGGYGLFYTLARVKRASALDKAAYGCFALLVAVTLGIVALTPLALGWKLLVVASCVAYFKIPPLTWRYLEAAHQ